MYERNGVKVKSLQIYRLNAKKLMGLCAAVYFCSYLTRNNYSAVMVEMIAKEGFAKSEAAAALTGLFFTYAIGQIISGYLGDRLRPSTLIFCGLLVSAAMNCLIPVSGNAWTMTVIWCVNGFAQAFMWPPIVKILSSFLEEEEYKKAAVRVNWGGSLGTVFVYFAAPALIAVGSWKYVFVFSAAAAAAMAFLWLFGYRKIEKGAICAKTEGTPAADSDKDNKERLCMPGYTWPILGTVMLAIIMHGILRDSITTWMPTYISEMFRMESTVSIFSGVVLPVFGILMLQVVSAVNRKFLKNEMLCAAVFFAVGAAALLLLSLFGKTHLIWAILMLMLAVGCMYGVNLILVCVIPNYFSRTGKASLVSGLLNACTYVGSCISTYGIAVVSEQSGWGATAAVWFAAAAFGTVLCAVLIFAWKRFKSTVNS